ncbi:DHA1 family purine base/nucleoside efflux pump-like MFS transporter [Cerasibacillus quisquiliarum]|mgnify:CR=1 FL=1|uniref:MFS transporter n=1 Tax=Cerasibacillus quisquiliarum TaxID=227865 RepID=A0A511V2S4_9BACI|nr:MFS transporter [Cerasibacillus quisquiliarum]MBB5146883.1 DHA1 family purine base/nucleoside efflux pump-like MFS transporter [Cerasibacillus quisquiliarum]GEN31622.1 MFS transporter [Cerasibacillus quisquiliarum]
MDKRVYFLMIVSFIIGMVELIIGGILDLIATDLQVSLGKAGFLITIFSLIFAIAGPILLIVTANVERKRLTLISLYVFLIGNIITVISSTYFIVFIGRVVTATSGALLIILCLVMAPRLVEEKYRGRAIGLVSMGVSASLVLGVPLGMTLGHSLGWRAPFILVCFLTVFSILGVHVFMDRVRPKPSIPLNKQLATLKSKKILFAHLTTFLFLAGHTTIYAYLNPFLQETMGLTGNWISIIYFIFGIAAVSGGGLGGTLADILGAKKTILSVTIIFATAIFLIPITTSWMPIFLVILIIWGIMSWAISPAMQSYLIETSPETSDIQQSLNNSSLHFGIAFGSFVGSIVIENISVVHNATVGGVLVVGSLLTAIISMISQTSTTK